MSSFTESAELTELTNDTSDTQAVRVESGTCRHRQSCAISVNEQATSCVAALSIDRAPMCGLDWLRRPRANRKSKMGASSACSRS